MSPLIGKKIHCLIILIVLQSDDAQKTKKVAELSCPGISSESSFDMILRHAADLSTAGRNLDALLCFTRSKAMAKTEEQRSVATFNIAVVQKDLGR